MKAWSAVLSFLYPPRCAFCGKIMEWNNTGGICMDCRLSLRYCLDKLCCSRCGKPIPSAGEKGLCYECLSRPSFPCKRIVSVLEYDKTVRRSISAYKGGQPRRGNAGAYADMLALLIRQEYPEIPFDYIIGVPPSRERMRKKNFDHIAFLCKKLSKRTGIPFLPHALYQKHRMRKQSSLTYEERRKNVIGNFAVRRAAVTKLKGTCCLLIDDICTTRATLYECARALKHGGVKTVYAATLATVLKNHAENGL